MNGARHMVAADGFDFSSRTFTWTAELLGFVLENPSHYSLLGMTSHLGIGLAGSVDDRFA